RKKTGPDCFAFAYWEGLLKGLPSHPNESPHRHQSVDHSPMVLPATVAPGASTTTSARKLFGIPKKRARMKTAIISAISSTFLIILLLIGSIGVHDSLL